MKTGPYPVFAAIAFMLSAACPLYADRAWDGGSAANDFWTTPDNWLGDIPPPNPETGMVQFRNDDLGFTNVMNQGWIVRYLIYTNQSESLSHVTDLGGNTLIISNGYLAAGYLKGNYTNHPIGTRVVNTRVTITNGTLQLGSPGAPAGLCAGYALDGYNYGSAGALRDRQLASGRIRPARISSPWITLCCVPSRSGGGLERPVGLDRPVPDRGAREWVRA